MYEGDDDNGGFADGGPTASEYPVGRAVWYEPEPGVRFAGLVAGYSAEGTIVLSLTAHYMAWATGRGHRHVPRNDPSITPRARGRDLTDVDRAWLARGMA